MGDGADGHCFVTTTGPGGEVIHSGISDQGGATDFSKAMEQVLSPTGFVIGGALALGAYALNENRKKKKKKDESSEQDGGGS